MDYGVGSGIPTGINTTIKEGFVKMLTVIIATLQTKFWKYVKMRVNNELTEYKGNDCSGWKK